jgi:hypothetical protein
VLDKVADEMMAASPPSEGRERPSKPINSIYMMATPARAVRRPR